MSICILLLNCAAPSVSPVPRQPINYDSVQTLFRYLKSLNECDIIVLEQLLHKNMSFIDDDYRIPKEAFIRKIVDRRESSQIKYIALDTCRIEPIPATTLVANNAEGKVIFLKTDSAIRVFYNTGKNLSKQDYYFISNQLVKIIWYYNHE